MFIAVDHITKDTRQIQNILNIRYVNNSVDATCTCHPIWVSYANTTFEVKLTIYHSSFSTYSLIPRPLVPNLGFSQI